MEFKGHHHHAQLSAKDSINRIRLEFKVISEHVAVVSRQGVLIESDWNLKGILRPAAAVSGAVLIESDWNLKVIETEEPPVVVAVLIESD